jgi:hypothetical protein
MTEEKSYEELEKEFRNEVIEEIAQELEKFTFAFGVDTVASFTTFVRGLKND